MVIIRAINLSKLEDACQNVRYLVDGYIKIYIVDWLAVFDVAIVTWSF